MEGGTNTVPVGGDDGSRAVVDSVVDGVVEDGVVVEEGVVLLNRDNVFVPDEESDGLEISVLARAVEDGVVVEVGVVVVRYLTVDIGVCKNVHDVGSEGVDDV